MIEKKEVKKIYYLLSGLYESIDPLHQTYVTKKTCIQFNELLTSLKETTEDGIFLLYSINENECDINHIRSAEMKNYLNPVIYYLKNFYIESGEYHIAKIGYLYNSLEDPELKERCGDILLGDSAFDRAINQATQVLENRIKIKAGLDTTPLIGSNLVSKAIHSKIVDTILKFSDKPDIQEGYSNLFKGIVSVYRNPTHHTLSFECSREYALKVCSHIDELLKIIESSEKIK